MSQTGYMKQAWALLRRDKGWHKPLLVMSAADYVPVAGFLGTSGYVLEWARLTAWGVDASPKQKNVQIGKCISSGFRAIVVALGMGVCIGLFFAMLTGIASVFPDVIATLLTLVIGFVQMVFSIVYGAFLAVCSIRTAIYEKISAGYRIDRVFQMIRRDLSGFGRLVLINFVAEIVLVAVMFAVIMVMGITFLPLTLTAMNGGDDYAIIMALTQSLVPMAVVFVLGAFVFGFAYHLYSMLFYTAVALWMRQFDVSAWGRSEDPLPEPHARPAEANMPSPGLRNDVQATYAPQSQPQHVQPMPQPMAQTTPQANAAHETKPQAGATENTPVVQATQPSTRTPDVVAPEGPAYNPAAADAAPEGPAASPATDADGPDVKALYDQLNNIIRQDDEE